MKRMHTPESTETPRFKRPLQGLLAAWSAFLAVMMVGFSYAAPVSVFESGFEGNTAGWVPFGSTVTAVASGTGGVASANGSGHALVSLNASGAYTRWGEYRLQFPAGGYRSLVKIYLDVSGGWNDGSRFDWSVASSKHGVNEHLRDFVFNVGFYNTANSVATGTGNRFVISGSNNADASSAVPYMPGRDPVAVTESGWYTFEHKFVNAGGVLSVEMTLYNPTGSAVQTWTRSTASDVIGSNVGGNRYGWIMNYGFASLAIDAASLEFSDEAAAPGVENTTTGWRFASIQAAIDAANSGDVIEAAIGTYNERLTISKSLTLRSAAGRAATIINGSAAAGDPGGAVTLVGAAFNQPALSGITVEGFTIVGYDGPPGIEKAALYAKGHLQNISILNNDIQANGDSAMTWEYSGAKGSNILISGNIFSGSTFVPPVPGTGGSAVQFTAPNIPRQAIVMGNGGGTDASLLTGVTFTNNTITAASGGMDGSTPGSNYLATIDCTGLVATGNIFSGTTTAFHGALRVRRQAADISGNTFNVDAMADLSEVLNLSNNTDPANVLLANEVKRGGEEVGFAYLAGGTTGISYHRINRAIEVAPASGSVLLSPGEFSEYVVINKPLTLQGAPDHESLLIRPKTLNQNAIQITASNVTVTGLKITRDGNNATEWTSLGAASAAIGINGQPYTNVVISENWIYGMRTGLDINNSNGHTIRANLIELNHTGMIFRNQTDNLVVEQNYVINNRTVGILMLTGTTGGGAPPWQALGSRFNNNNISGNWYAQIADRQVDLVHPTPGTTNLKDFSGNWFGTATPGITTADSGEPAYDILIPTYYTGGTAVAPAPRPEVAGIASANFDISPIYTSGVDSQPGVFGFQGDSSFLQVLPDGSVVVGADTESNIQQAVNSVTDGSTVKVPSGTYNGDVDATGKSVKFTIGSSPGQVTINGDFILDSDDTLQIEIENPGLTPGTDFDQVVVNGSVVLGGATLELLGGFNPAIGNSVPFIVNDGSDAIGGIFDGLTEGTVIAPFLSPGQYAKITYVNGSPANDVAVVFPPQSIAVEQPLNTPLAPTGATIDFGFPPVATPVDRVFTIRNTGTANLTISGVNITGSPAFAVTTLPAATVLPGQSTTLTVTYTPVAGNATATLAIDSDDLTDGDYTIALKGRGTLSPSFVVDGGTSYMTLQDAVTNALPGSNIVFTGDYVMTGSVTLDKPGLTLSGTGYLYVDSGDGSHALRLTVPGVTVNGLGIVKTDKATGAIFYVSASNVTVQNCDISGQYVLGDPEVTRVFEVTGGLTNVSILNNSMRKFRQPGYLNASVYNIAGNYVAGTRGWVLEGADVTFSDNTWGAGADANYLDIAILSVTPPGLYPDITAVSKANNDAAIEDQRPGADPASLLSTTFADVSYTGANGASNGTITRPFTSITGAVNRVLASGTVKVAPGTYNEDVILPKTVALKGAGADVTTISGPIGGTGDTVRINASNSIVQGFTLTRAGNNVTDWNNSGLNGSGIAIQGQSFSGNIIRNNIITGMRTGIDVNASSGHSILNNEITNNHTGLIFRNQNDNLVVEQNIITENRTLGIVFLDASSGTNVPVQQALNCQFVNNAIFGNWYGQIVDRQTGGSLPPAGSNVKDFSGNWFGTATPVVVTTNSAEPGYAALIPVAFGGSATAPGGQPDICGPASANIDYSPLLTTGTDTDVETETDRGTHGFQGDFTEPVLQLTGAQNPALSRIQDLINLDSNGVITIPSATYPGNVDATAAGKNITFNFGASPGSVVIGGNLALNAGDTLNIDIESNVAGTGYDQITVNGTVALGGAAVVFNDSYTVVAGDEIQFLVNDAADAVTGTFDGLDNGEIVADVAGLPAIGYAVGSGNDIALGFPAISVLDGPTVIVEAQPTAVDIGTRTPTSGTPTKVFTLENEGVVPLEVTGISVGAPFTLSGISFPVLLEPGQTTTFSISMPTNTPGTYNATVEVAATYTPGNAFDFPITGLVTPDVVVTPGGNAGEADVDVQIYNAAGTDPFTVTVTVPAAPNDNTYRLTRSSGTWGTISLPGVSSADTNVLTITKADVDKVTISDATGLGSGLVGVIFEGRGSNTTAGIRTFDDDFVVELDTATAGTVDFTGNCQFTGVASLTVETLKNILVSSARTVEVLNGNLNFTANRGPVATSGEYVGVRLDNGTVRTTGTGLLSLDGRGGNLTSEPDSAQDIRGVVLINGGKVRSTSTAADAGTITVVGTGGPSTETTTRTSGVVVTGGSSHIFSARGDVSVTGNSEYQGASNSSYGISVAQDADITVGLDGDLTLTGTGASGEFGSAHHGVHLNSPGALITAAEGSLTIVGSGGTFSGDTSGTYQGVVITGGITVGSTGSATVDITGTGGTGEDDNVGIFIESSGVVTASNGLLTLNGTGGGHNAAASASNYGIRISSAGIVRSTGTADIQINANGNGLPTSVYAQPLSVDGAGSAINSAAGSGDIVIAANGVRLPNSGVLNAGSNAVTIRPSSVRPVSLGGSDSLSLLGLTQAELSLITAASLTVGDVSTASSVTVDSAMAVPAGVDLTLAASGDIDLNATVTSADDITLTSATGIVKADLTGTELTAAKVAFGSGTNVEIPIKGTTADSEAATGYRKLTVAGGVDLTGADLVIPADTFVPVLGNSFVIVDGTTALTGTFAGLPQGHLFPNFRGSSRELRVDYTADSGNDVVLTLVAPEIRVYDGVTELADAQPGAVSFGSTTVGGPVSKTFTITNDGLGTLAISSVTAPAGYTVGAVPASVAPGDSEDVIVTFNATSAGTFTGDVTITTDDVDEAVFTFPITATATPQVVVVGGSPNAVVNVELANTGNDAFGITVAVPAAPNDNTYTLTRSAGNWNFVETPGVATGTGTPTLTIFKAAVTNVNLSDSTGLGTGLVGVTFDGRGTATSGRTFEDSFSVVLDTATAGTVSFTGNCQFTGISALTVDTLRNVAFAASRSTTVENGNLSIIANRGVTATAGQFVGIDVRGTVETVGSGSITLNGRSGNSGTETFVRGVAIVAGGKVLSTAPTATGAITLTGTGGETTTSPSNSRGVVYQNSASSISSRAGKITITGDTFGTLSTGQHFGVYFSNDIQLVALEEADVEITGTGAGGGDYGINNAGVQITGSASQVKVTDGNLVISGYGGDTTNSARSGQHGVWIQGGADILSLGDGEVTIYGEGGAGGTASYGVNISGSGSQVSGIDGDVTVTGLGGGSGITGANNRGIVMTSSVIVRSTGTGNIFLTGTEGAGTSNQGVVISASSQIISESGTGDVVITTDELNMSSDVVIDLSDGVHSNSITFKPRTSRPLLLGGADTDMALGIGNDEVNCVTSGTVIIGDLANTSNIVLSANPNGIVAQANVNLELYSIGNIEGGTSYGRLTTSGTGTLEITSSMGALQPKFLDSALAEIITGGGLSFGSGFTTGLEFNVNGPAVNVNAGESGYRRLRLEGTIDLSNTALSLTGTYAGAALGQKFSIIANDGSDAITGTFTGLADARRITANFVGSGKSAWIDYLGGDGNDVDIVVGDPDIQVTDPATNVLAVSPVPVVDFENLAPGTFEDHTFTLTNTGTSKLELVGISLQAGTDAEFTLQNLPAAGLFLQPGESTTFEVRFYPNSLGDFDGSILITSNDLDEGSFVINLEGEGAFDPVIPVPSALGPVATGFSAPGADGTTPVGTFGPLQRGGFLAENSALVFPGELVGGATGIWKTENVDTPNSLKLVALTGQAHPEGPELYDLMPEIPAINRTGQVSYVARLSGGSITTANDTGLWSEVGGPQGPLLVAQEGVDEVAAGVTIAGFGSGGINANAPLSSAAGWATAQVGTDAEVAFSATLKGTGVTAANATSIIRVSYADSGSTVGAPVVMARQGTLAPGAATATFGNLAGNFSDPVRMDEAGNMAFGAVITGGSGVYYAPKGQSLAKVAATGDIAPGTDDATFKTLEAPTLGTNGYVAFRGFLNNNGSNANGKTNDGIWAGQASNPAGLQVILRRGYIINPDRTVTAPTGAPAEATMMKVGNPWGGWLTRNGDNRGAWRAWVDMDGDGVVATRNAPENDVQAIFANTDGTMRMAVAEGDVAQGYFAATFTSLDHPIAGGDNQIAFVGTVGGLISPGVAANSFNNNNKGIWRQSPNGGPFYLIIRTGQTMLVNGVARTVKNVDLPGSGVNISGSRRIEQPVMDATGRLIIYVTLENDDTTQVLAP